MAAREDPFVRRQSRSHRSIRVVAVVVESLLFVDFVSVARASLFIRSACAATKIRLRVTDPNLYANTIVSDILSVTVL